MLNLMALRYGDFSGEITLENFIVLVLRMDCMASESEYLTYLCSTIKPVQFTIIVYKKTSHLCTYL